MDILIGGTKDDISRNTWEGRKNKMLTCNNKFKLGDEVKIIGDSRFSGCVGRIIFYQQHQYHKPQYGVSEIFYSGNTGIVPSFQLFNGDQLIKCKITKRMRGGDMWYNAFNS